MRSWRAASGGGGLITLDGNWQDDLACPLQQIPRGDFVFFRNVMKDTTLVFEKTGCISPVVPFAMLLSEGRPRFYLSSAAGPGPDILCAAVQSPWEIHLWAFEELGASRQDRYCRYFWRRKMHGLPVCDYASWDESMPDGPVVPAELDPNQQLFKKVAEMFEPPVSGKPEQPQRGIIGEDAGLRSIGD